MARPEKVAAVKQIAEDFSTNESIVFADYRGLSVKSITELRAKLREVGGEFKVIKNTLAARAAEECGIDGLDDVLAGPTGMAVGADDPAAAAKVLSEYAKDVPLLEIKGGVLKGEVIAVDEVKALAALPSRDVLVAQVVRGMQSPISGLANVLAGPVRNLAYVLEAIRQQKEAA